MAKGKAVSAFFCQNCGYESSKWMGQCICGAWNSFVEERVIDSPETDNRRRGSAVGRAGAGFRADQ